MARAESKDTSGTDGQGELPTAPNGARAAVAPESSVVMRVPLDLDGLFRDQVDHVITRVGHESASGQSNPELGVINGICERLEHIGFGPEFVGTAQKKPELLRQIIDLVLFYCGDFCGQSIPIAKARGELSSVARQVAEGIRSNPKNIDMLMAVVSDLDKVMKRF